MQNTSTSQVRKARVMALRQARKWKTRTRQMAKVVLNKQVKSQGLLILHQIRHSLPTTPSQMHLISQDLIHQALIINQDLTINQELIINQDLISQDISQVLISQRLTASRVTNSLPLLCQDSMKTAPLLSITSITNHPHHPTPINTLHQEQAVMSNWHQSS